MNCSVRTLAFLSIVLFLNVSCTDDDENIIIDFGGSAEYFINNQTSNDVIVIFQKSEELGLEIDTTNVIERNTSIKILDDFIIGVNPVPDNSFKEIKFYISTDINNPFLVLTPVENEDWTPINQNLGSSGYGLTTYEIKLTD